MASANDDVPLGEGARQYYENLFGARINQVRKGGPPPAGGGPGMGSRTGGGLVVIAVLLGLRLLLGLGGSSHHAPSMPSYSPAPRPVEVELPQFRRDPQVEEALKATLRQLQHDREPGPVKLDDQVRNVPTIPMDLQFAKPSPRFEVADLPLPEGLCCRIVLQSRQPEPSPGRRLWQFLDAPTRALIGRAAAGGELTPEEVGALCQALNRVLERRDFFDEDSFRNVELSLKVHQLARGEGEEGQEPARRTELLNRLALEAAYPKQIIPWQQRLALDEGIRARRQLRALRDQLNAKRESGPGKP